MTHPDDPSVLAAGMDSISSSLRQGAMKRCFMALEKAGRGRRGHRDDLDEDLAIATMRITSKIGQCSTRPELVDFVIRFVGGLDIFSLSADTLDDDPDILAVDKAVKDHDVSSDLAHRPGQAARTLKNIGIDRANKKGEQTGAIGHTKPGISIGGNDEEDDALLRDPKVTGSAFRTSAERTYFTDAYDPAQDRVSVELIRAIYLPVLLDRGQARDAGSSKARTWIRYFHLTAMWLSASGQNSNQYARDHEGVHASDLTKAHQWLSEALRVCVYVDDLLCPARPPYDPDDQPWSPAAPEADLRAALAALLSPPGDADAPTQGPGPGGRTPTVTQRTWLLESPRYAHLDACLNVVDRIDADKTLTAVDAKILRLASSAVTTTEDAGTRVSPNRYVLLALDLDPGIKKELTAFRKHLKTLKQNAAEYIEAKLLGEDIDTHYFGYIIADFFSGDGNADVLEGVSPRSKVRAARLAAVRTGRPDPYPDALPIDPSAEATRLVQALQQPAGSSAPGQAIKRMTRLVGDHGTPAERSDVQAFLAKAADPASIKPTVNSLRRMITIDQASELKRIIATAVNHRIGEAPRDRFSTDASKPHVIARLHEAETRYAYWAHSVFAPEEPLVFNCVRPSDDHNPSLDRTAEITL